MPSVDVRLGDCREILPTLPDASIDAVVTDPPYELGFMGRAWDASGIAYDVEVWRQCLRVLRPGGHLLAFGGTRTAHRLACAVEDAGFEIRDSITWLYGSGFPKSLDVSKAIDKAAGAEREVVGANPNHRAVSGVGYEGVYSGGNTGASVVTAPATPDAARWAGWGTALKPASEPIVVARKPLAGTVAANVLAHGTGALNIDACRVVTSDALVTFDRVAGDRDRTEYRTGTGVNRRAEVGAGRWPANVVLSHAPDCTDGGPCVDGCPVAELDAQSGTTTSKASGRGERHGTIYGGGAGPSGPDSLRGHDDSGGASRFFPVFRYQAKAGSRERPRVNGVSHPTVKPLTLMRWLIRLVTPPGGTVLDPFAGSGTTGEAALLEGFSSIMIEREPEYLALITERLAR